MTHKHTLIQTQAQLVHTQTPTKMMHTKTQTQGHTQIEGKYIILMDKPLHWRHPLATCTKYKPVSSKMTIISFSFATLFSSATTTYLSLFCLMSAGQRVQKHFEGKQKIHNLFVWTIYSYLLIYFMAKTQTKSSLQREDQWPCWGHFGGQQLLSLWADNW